MVCGSVESLHSALVTLVQLLRVCTTASNGNEKGMVPPVVIMDQPSLVHRGFLLDLSPHARVPTLVRLKLVLLLHALNIAMVSNDYKCSIIFC